MEQYISHIACRNGNRDVSRKKFEFRKLLDEESFTPKTIRNHTHMPSVLNAMRKKKEDKTSHEIKKRKIHCLSSRTSLTAYGYQVGIVQTQQQLPAFRGAFLPWRLKNISAQVRSNHAHPRYRILGCDCKLFGRHEASGHRSKIRLSNSWTLFLLRRSAAWGGILRYFTSLRRILCSEVHFSWAAWPSVSIWSIRHVPVHYFIWYNVYGPRKSQACLFIVKLS